MKHFFTILILTLSQLIMAQYCSLDQLDFEPYFFTLKKGNTSYSLDSIRCGSKLCFISTNKSQNQNIVEANLSASSNSPWSLEFDSVSLKYFNDSNIESYLRLHDFYQETDTTEFSQFDEIGRVLNQQYRYDLWCGTGAPYDEYKDIYSYNEEGEVLYFKRMIKWNYETEIRPYNIWVDHYQFSYEYEEGKIKSEYLQSNYFREDEDTVRLELFPYQMKSYAYNNDRVAEVLTEEWSLDNELWNYLEKESYSYSGDSIFKTLSIWDLASQSWIKKQRQISIPPLNYENKILQIWDDAEQKWQNYSKTYYSPSGVDDYLNYYSEKWKNADQSWYLSFSTEYFYAGDTIEQLRFSEYGPDRKYQYLYNVYGDLLLSKSYVREEGGMQLKYEVVNEYNEDGILLKNVESSFDYYNMGDTITCTKEYFWDQTVGSQEYPVLSKFTIAPNPVAHELNIQSEERIMQVWIFDSQGRQVKVSHNKHIPVGDLPPGVYFLKVLQPGGKYGSGQFIKI